MKSRVYRFLNDSFWGSLIITLLIVLSVVIFTFETEYPDVKWLLTANVIIAVLFMFEYFARIWTANENSLQSNPRLSYIFSFYGIIDLLAFLPMLLFPAASGSTALRLMRLMRLAQIMKIRAITTAFARVKEAIVNSRNELIMSISVSLALIFLGAVVMYIVEGKAQPEAFGSIPRAMWWSMATLTTVGYGDVYPVTGLGKVVAAIMALIGIAAVAMPAGILAAAFINEKDET